MGIWLIVLTLCCLSGIFLNIVPLGLVFIMALFIVLNWIVTIFSEGKTYRYWDSSHINWNNVICICGLHFILGHQCECDSRILREYKEREISSKRGVK